MSSLITSHRKTLKRGLREKDSNNDKTQLKLWQVESFEKNVFKTHGQLILRFPALEGLRDLQEQRPRKNPQLPDHQAPLQPVPLLPDLEDSEQESAHVGARAAAEGNCPSERWAWEQDLNSEAGRVYAWAASWGAEGAEGGMSAEPAALKI